MREKWRQNEARFARAWFHRPAPLNLIRVRWDTMAGGRHSGVSTGDRKPGSSRLWLHTGRSTFWNGNRWRIRKVGRRGLLPPGVAQDSGSAHSRDPRAYVYELSGGSCS